MLSIIGLRCIYLWFMNVKLCIVHCGWYVKFHGGHLCQRYHFHVCNMVLIWYICKVTLQTLLVLEYQKVLVKNYRPFEHRSPSGHSRVVWVEVVPRRARLPRSQFLDVTQRSPKEILSLAWHRKNRLRSRETSRRARRIQTPTLSFNFPDSSLFSSRIKQLIKLRSSK